LWVKRVDLAEGEQAATVALDEGCVLSGQLDAQLRLCFAELLVGGGCIRRQKVGEPVRTRGTNRLHHTHELIEVHNGLPETIHCRTHHGGSAPMVASAGNKVSEPHHGGRAAKPRRRQFVRGLSLDPG
jgi:hypothetical protein